MDQGVTGGSERVFALLDEDDRRTLVEGLRHLARLEEAKQDSLARFVARSGGRPRYGLNTSDAARELKADPGDVGPALGALSIIVGLVISRSGGLLGIAEEAARSGIVSEEGKASFERLLGRLEAERDELREILERRLLADRTLPSLEGFSASIDVRLSVEDRVPASGVPVGVVRLTTDLDEEGFVFQVTRGQVLKLIEDLQQLGEGLEAAKKIAKGVRGK